MALIVMITLSKLSGPILSSRLPWDGRHLKKTRYDRLYLHLLTAQKRTKQTHHTSTKRMGQKNAQTIILVTSGYHLGST